MSITDQPWHVDCPLRECSWTTRDGTLHDATRRTLEHLAAEHREELQLMLAGVDGGHGVPVVCTFTQQIDARQVQDAADLVAGVLVPKMRAQMAADLARKNLRPLDPWPAVTVRRFAWSTSERWAATMHNGDAPVGMLELTDEHLTAGMAPDLYQLELRTDAVQDPRTVQL